MLLMSRSTRFAFALPNGLLAQRPPVCGITMGERFMYFARPASCTTTSLSSYFSNSFISYLGRFFGFFGSRFAFSTGGGSSASAVSPGTSVGGAGSLPGGSARGRRGFGARGGGGGLGL